MSPFLSFLFSDSLFLSSSFLFICHSTSKGCKLVTGEPNSAHNWALLGPQGGLFFLVFFFFLLTLNNHEIFFFKNNLDFELYLKNRKCGKPGPHYYKVAISWSWVQLPLTRQTLFRAHRPSQPPPEHLFPDDPLYIWGFQVLSPASFLLPSHGFCWEVVSQLVKLSTFKVTQIWGQNCILSSCMT